MEKFWVVYGLKNSGVFTQYKSYAEASNEAKRQQAANRGNVYFILEAIAATEDPVPDIKINKL